MRNTDMAAMLVPRLEQAAQSSNIGWHTGVIGSWDELTGLNTVEIGGTLFTNVLVLSTGAPQAYVPGDVVIVLRLSTQYFIVGKVRAPGYGAGERIASRALTAEVSTTSNDYVDLGGPELTVYIGSSRRALVLISVSCAAENLPDAGGAAFANVAVSGASSIAPMSYVAAYLGLNPATDGGSAISGSAASNVLLTADDGLEQGQNTFRLMYASGATAGGNARFLNRKLTVLPF